MLARLVLLPLTLAHGYFEKVSTILPPRTRESRYGRFEYLPYPVTANQQMSFSANDSESLNRVVLHNTCGVSYEMENLSTAVLLTKRHLLSAANYLEPHFEAAKNLRVWCFGNTGYFDRPFRYRVWRVTRLVPKSMNSEQEFTYFSRHVMIHDIALIQTQDPVIISQTYPTKQNMAVESKLPTATEAIPAGSCRIQGLAFETKEDLELNYGIVYHYANTSDIVDCNIYLPKFWGPYICFKNVDVLYGLTNGAGLHCGPVKNSKLFALGSFEIRYNDERILVFTDVRKYIDKIKGMTRLIDHEYYEYAMSEYGDQLVKKETLYPEFNKD